MKHSSIPLFIVVAGLLSFTGNVSTRAQGTAFTYQGRLDDGGVPATGLYDLEIHLYAVGSGGAPIAGGGSFFAHPVTNGLFTVTLDYLNSFTGADRWLEIAVKTNGGPAFQTLAPRHKITATPYAITAGNLTGPLPSSGLSGAYNSAVNLANPANQFTGGFTGNFIGNGAGVSNVNAATLNGLTSANFWQTNGNLNANPTNGAFVGTRDNLPLEVKVNGQRAQRFEPVQPFAANGPLAPNLIGGSESNRVLLGARGATIAGGGPRAIGEIGNTVSGDFGTIGGGRQNQVRFAEGTVAGGRQNLAEGFNSTVGGGHFNTATTNYATISGGSSNSASGVLATVAGGMKNQAAGRLSLAAGHRAKAIHDGAFVWADSTDLDFSSTRASQFLVRASGGVGINTNNPQTALHVNGDFATVEGSAGEAAYLGADGTGDVEVGSFNPSVSAVTLWNRASATEMSLVAKGAAFRGPVTVAGALLAGANNQSTGPFSTVLGGKFNTASGEEGTVAGGAFNNASGFSSTVSGGGANQASGPWSTIAGGREQTNSGDYANIGGGYANRIEPGAIFGTISGGWVNRVLAQEGTVSGGGFNTASGFSSTVGGGGANTASGHWSTIGGGREQTNSGDYATIAGGVQNSVLAGAFGASILGGQHNVAAGSYAHAAGYRAQANHHGSFVWADNSSDTPFASSGNYQFLVRAGGGMGINTATPNGAALAVNGAATATAVQSPTVNAGALVVTNSLRVPGAGIGTTGPAFVHRVTAANIEAGASHRTTINHPLCNGDPNAILIFTHNYNPGATGGTLNTNPTSVFYNSTLGHWQIYHDNFAAMTQGDAWNILVFKP